MTEIINHHRRFVVTRSWAKGPWAPVASFRFLWRAKRYARAGESYGIFAYRVEDRGHRD